MARLHERHRDRRTHSRRAAWWLARGCSRLEMVYQLFIHASDQCGCTNLQRSRSFLGQVPVFVAAIVICWVIFRSLEAKEQSTPPESTATTASNFARIDFLGATSLGLGLLSLMLPLEIGGQKVPWSHPAIFVLATTGLLMLGIFITAETRWAKEPIFPLRLLTSRDALLCYCITGCTLAAQSGVRAAVIRKRHG